MLSGVTSYIARQIFSITFIATFCLCILVTLVQSVKVVDMIVSSGLSLADFLELSLLAAPRYLGYLLPIVLFGATLSIYNRMSADNEIIALKAAGFSRFRLAKGSLITAAIITLICASVTLYFVPISQSKLREIITFARSQIGVTAIREGQFIDIGKDSTIFVREKQGQHTFLGLIYYSKPDNLTVIAKRGTLVETPQGPRLVIYDGNKQTHQNGDLHIVNFKKSVLDIGLSSAQLEERWRGPKERFVGELLNPDLNNARDRKNYNSLIAEGHNRLLIPVFCLTLSLIAVSVMLNSSHSRQTKRKPTFLAIGFMLTALILHLWLVSAAAKNPTFIYLMYTNAFLPALIALYFLFHNRVKHKR